MDRAEAAGFGVAVVGHGALLLALTLGLARMVAPPPQDSIEVSFVDEVGLTSASPQPAQQPPEQGMAPEAGPTEDAAPAPLPEPIPPMPEPRPEPPQPRAAPPEPRPQPKQATPTPPRQRPRAQPTPQRPAPPQRSAGTGERNRRSLIGPDLLKGLGRDPSPSRSRQAPAATMSARAAADIASAIARQVQPCADRQVDPGPGASRIVTALNLRLNRDGSLAARPRVVRQTGLDDENSRYADRVADLAIRSFVECAPLRGLPAELYEVPNGWRNFTMRYRLPG
ncbi:MAG TPA: cell envelope biogenesis protein TolA [Allosphingosinicella sp.]|jgi:outer membrane biosynthesis protein TonB|nr:cell envelope biogenesis protein TolA [Allosphingosinicella sp.]